MGKTTEKQKIGLVLGGGGARAAYQVGVLKALSELAPKDIPNPFPVICGTSAGAINSAALAIYGQRFHLAVQSLLRVWRNFHVGHVFRSDTLGIMQSGAHWMLMLMLGGLGKRNPVSFLDREPLRDLLTRYLPCDEIQKAIDQGIIEALGITASGYSSGQSVTFFQGLEHVEAWRRVRRIGCKSAISVNHLMASSAIPFIFGPERINREYFGDGSMRQTAPISPALHLGADKVMVIGVTNARERQPAREAISEQPTLAQIAGHILNSIFLDSLDADLERLWRINHTISLIPSKHLEEHGVTLRQVEALVISPSQDIQEYANRYAHELPRTIRFFLRGIGAFNKNGTSLVSYLLFEKSYCRELISLGYADAMQRKDEVVEFMEFDR